jgi:hypothetical protein
VTIDLDILHVLCAYVTALQDEFIISQALIFAVNLYYAVAIFLSLSFLHVLAATVSWQPTDCSLYA